MSETTLLCRYRKRTTPTYDAYRMLGTPGETEEEFLPCYKEQCAFWLARSSMKDGGACSEASIALDMPTP